MIKSYWKWHDRAENTGRLRRLNDETVHLRSNGDLYFVYSNVRHRRIKVRTGQKKQA